MEGFIKKIDKINFGILSPDDIRAMSAVTVETPDTFEDDGFPIEKGLMDPRLGVIDPSLVCRTCGERGGNCQGHFGSIELARPVIHIGFGDIIHKILRSICNNCGRILLPQDVLDDYNEKITKALDNKESIESFLKKIQSETKKVEMSENKQNEIVRKIMEDLYSEEGELNRAEREETLLNILNQLYTEAYQERIDDGEKPQFKYIDPKQLCPHCKKNQSLADIEASYPILKTKNMNDIQKIYEKSNKTIDNEYETEYNKLHKKLTKLQEKFNEYEETKAVDSNKHVVERINELIPRLENNFKSSSYGGKYNRELNIFNKIKENFAKLIEDRKLNFKSKVEDDIKKSTEDYVRNYILDLIQEPVHLDKPVTIRQGDYRLTPFEVRERLERISNEDAFVLGINYEVARPEWLVLTVLPVPPVTVRPSITLDTGERSEDDLTHKLVDILRLNQRLLENMEAGAPQLIVDDLWELLQYHVITYFDNDSSGVPPARHRSGRPLITLMQRFKGHEKDAMHNESKGRFRDHLTGKRVNFSARTVVSPDPNIGINEIGVPEIIAKELTVPMHVNEWNIERMKQYIMNGPNVYPGAKYVISKDGEKIRKCNEENVDIILQQLEPGFIIERHLIDGDIVLLNRHPSLHKLSILAHEVRILPHNTFRINPAVCPPYNVDFDGDEMNIHVLQTEESRAESKHLMHVENNMRSPRFGGPLIGAIRDHISGAYLLTKTGTTFTEEEALQIIKKSGLEMPIFENNRWILKQGCKIYKRKGELWTGKELFSLTLPNDLNMSFLAEISKSSLFNPEDSLVVIKDGILLQGAIDEVAFGSFKGKILDKIWMTYGSKKAKDFLEKALNLSLCALMKIGITNSINDYEIPRIAQDKINNHLDKKMIEVDKIIQSYEKDNLQTLSDKSLEETLDKEISQVLNDARDMAGDIAENHYRLPNEDLSFSTFGRHSYVMAHTGAKSSRLNITQISACVGQQSIRGQSLYNAFNKRGYQKRLLPHIKKGELNAKSIGFVKSSFLKGLNPTEFFFHAMGGRDTMADKSIRVAASGYMQRRLINALQDVHTDKNGMVKDNRGNVIQMLYGEDGVDPVKTDFGKPIDLNSFIDELRMKNSFENSYNNDLNTDDDSENGSNEKLSDKELKKLKIKSDYLSNKIKYTIKSYSNEIKEINKESYRTHDDNEVEQMLNQLNQMHDDLIEYQKYCNDFKFLDEISEKIKTADSDLKIIKTNFKQKLSDIIRLESKRIDEKFEEHTHLVIEAESILDNKLVIFTKLGSRLNNLSDNVSVLSDHVNKNQLVDSLESIRFELNETDSKLNRIRYRLSNKDFIFFESFQQAVDEINILNRLIDELNQISENYFEEKITEQEEVYQSLSSLNDKIQSENIEKLLDDFDKCLTRPTINRQFKKNNLKKDDVDTITDGIKNDIINQVITGKPNFKKLIKQRCNEFKNNNLEFGENEIDRILDEFTFLEIDEDTLQECKYKVKKDYLEGRITFNQVELKLRNYVNKKIDESKQLKELDRIRKNPRVPDIKIHLTPDENDEIYRITENEILSEYGINDTVEYRVYYWANKKIRENQSEARNRLNTIKRDLSNITQLDNKQQSHFISQIELYIYNNQIYYYEITEENVIRFSEDFINYGEIKLR